MKNRLLAVSCCFLFACGGDPAHNADSDVQNSVLAGSHWVLKVGTHTTGVQWFPSDFRLFTLQFGEAGALSSSDNCNLAGGAYRVVDSTLSLNISRTTLVACLGGEGAVPASFNAELAAVRSFELTDTTFTAIKEDGGKLIFTKFFELCDAPLTVTQDRYANERVKVLVKDGVSADDLAADLDLRYPDFKLQDVGDCSTWFAAQMNQQTFSRLRCDDRIAELQF